MEALAKEWSAPRREKISGMVQQLCGMAADKDLHQVELALRQFGNDGSTLAAEALIQLLKGYLLERFNSVNFQTPDLTSEFWPGLEVVDATHANSFEEYRQILQAKGNSKSVPTAALVRPNKWLKVQIVEQESCQLSGQLEVVALFDIKVGVCIPITGQVTCADTSCPHYEVHLPKFQKRDFVLLANSQACSGACVNDAFGPDRSAQNKRSLDTGKNAKFVCIHDKSRFGHVFLQTIQPIRAGEIVLTDYGDSFWKARDEDVGSNLCVFAKAVLHSLRGAKCHPVVIS